MRTVRYLLILMLIASCAYAFTGKKRWGGDLWGVGKWGAVQGGGSGSTYWDTAMTDRWNTPMTALWNTPMNTEIP